MKYNFNAGPSHLNEEILERISNSIKNFENSGLSIIELSHRSKEFESVIEECKVLLSELLGLDSDSEVFFMQGGASFQFYTLPFNFLRTNDCVYYANTGRWAEKAIVEAKRFAKVKLAGSSKSDNYSRIPELEITNENARYLHITSNNTIYGTEYSGIPDCQIPIVADMSSDIMGRKFDYNAFDLIYAGAQKNLGTAGVAVVIAKKHFIQEAKEGLPPMLSYKNMIANNSLFNTPPVLAIYIVLETLRWSIRYGGIERIDKTNRAKAKLLYNTIDESNLYYGTARKEDRSLMNVCFKLKDKSLENKFIDFTNSHGIIGIKGHRSFGGFRASLYNCIPLEYVKVLTDVMKEFERKYG
ncbi:MAG: 3-phosphoserine/phosphohydroxythreonine transaminase [Chitinophagales bacterium]